MLKEWMDIKNEELQNINLQLLIRITGVDFI